MKFTPKTIAIAISLPFCSSQVFAAPNNFSDARSIAMGGTGVASSSRTGASFFNPAMLAINQDNSWDGFGLILPSISAHAADEEQVIKRILDYQDSETFETLQNSVNALNAADPDDIEGTVSALVSTATAVVEAAEQFNRDLVDLNQDAVRAQMGLGAALVIPGQSLSVSVFTNGTVKSTATMDYEDQDLYEFYRDEALKIANGDADALKNLSVPSINDLQSSGSVIAAAKAEIGIAFAREFEIQDRRYALGISPKLQTFRAYDYLANIETFDDDSFNLADYESEATAFNLDIGVATHFGDSKQWTLGFSGMNIIPVEINTADAKRVAAQRRGRIIEINPLYRLGMAYSAERYRIAADLDLTKNNAFGFEDDAQFLSIGGEIDVTNFMQVRAGIRQNLAGNNGREGAHESTLFTAGLGFSPFGVHLDISGVFAGGEAGAGAELGFTY
jgi:hypothetical protein